MTDFIQIKSKTKRPAQWRSVGELQGEVDTAALAEQASPNGQLAAEGDVTRRGFLGWSGFTLAAATAALSGCIRKAEEFIVPVTGRPEDYIPGKPRHFATAARFGSSVTGLLVASQDGRPVKVDGNPAHPYSLGGSTAWAQGELLNLYDGDRSRTPVHNGKAATWADWDTFAKVQFGSLRGAGGKGLALLIEDTRSPTYQRVISAFRSAFPQAKLYRFDHHYPAERYAGADAVGLRGFAPVLDLTKAKVILSLDSDFLGVDGDTVRNSKDFASTRTITDAGSTMSRLYMVEPGFSITGMTADNRLRVPASQVRNFLIALARKVLDGTPAPAGSAELVGALRAGALEPTAQKWADEVSKDLLANKGQSLLVAGDRQPAAVHALTHLVNAALGNVGRTVSFAPRYDVDGAGTAADLIAALNGGSVDTLLMLGGNPVGRIPAGGGFADALGKAKTTVHLSSHLDGTGKASTWHLPLSHWLESWGDHRATDGTVAIQQPLIAELFGTRSEIEVLGAIAGVGHKGHELVQATWNSGANFEATWRGWLHAGLVAGSASTLLAPTAAAVEGEDAIDASAATFSWGERAAILGAAHVPAGPSPVEVNWTTSYRVGDGRYGNNGWMQELPDPLTKITWDNVAQLSPKTAQGLGVSQGDLVTLELDGRDISLPAYITPGLADATVLLELGYGEEKGQFETGFGFDVNALRGLDYPHFRAGVGLSKGQGSHELASTQHHHTMEPGFGFKARPLVRENTIAEFKEDPEFVKGFELVDEEHLVSIYDESNITTGQQWGKAIDLNTCTGCGSCVIACNAENNIQIVGKERVAVGREMHWIRLDRYFTGDPEHAEAVIQPVGCQHCETAPCEQVCPVAATSHSPDGINDIAYNRCIGTRYCANNCPYKVRRFNFFNFTQENEDANELVELQRNPNVTPRFRGVIEKCSYCVQKVNEAKIEAKRDGDGHVPDGRIIPSCVQACPSNAIVFGDVSDPKTVVSQWKANPRNYAILADLNVRPRTTYLAKIRNPNPELA